MLKDGFLRFCDDPELACCRAESELGQLRSDNARLRAELAALREAERWIPVSERLPEPDKDVLIRCEDGFITTNWVESKTGEFGLWDGSGEVTHWREIPAPPAPEKGE